MKKLMLTLAGCLLLGACASTPRADIPASADPNEEIKQLEADIQTGYERHYDVLAYKDFKKSREALEEAKEDMRDEQDREEIIGDIAEARGYYNRATALVQSRAEKLDGVLNARLAAINAGARSFPKEKEKLNAIDDDLYDVAEDLKDMTPRQYDELQKQYMALESQAVQATHLGNARAHIASARDNNAKKYTPNTLERAEKDMANAQNVVGANVRNPGAYSAAVAKANASARLLTQVLATATRDKKVIPENVALEIVMKDRKISNLDEELSSTKDELSTTEAMTRSQQSAMAQQQSTLAQQKNILAINKAIQDVSKEFGKDEAEVYRQGNNVLIRLKGMHFASGRADLPEKSIALLEKVKDVTQELDATAITVEGHTDSVGSAAINKDLSQKRADTVAEFLAKSSENNDVEAVGYGFEKPITSNKTKEGRAQNRRVDVIITPKMAQAPSTTATME